MKRFEGYKTKSLNTQIPRTSTRPTSTCLSTPSQQTLRSTRKKTWIARKPIGSRHDDINIYSKKKEKRKKTENKQHRAMTSRISTSLHHSFMPFWLLHILKRKPSFGQRIPRHAVIPHSRNSLAGFLHPSSAKRGFSLRGFFLLDQFLLKFFFIRFFLVQIFTVHVNLRLDFLLHVHFFSQPWRTSSGILSPTRSTQLSRQDRNISPGTFILNQNLLKILELVLADLRVRGQYLLSGWAELQVTEDLSCERVHDWSWLLRYG